MAEMSESEITYELRNVTMKMQQLVERKKMLFIMNELMKRVDNNAPENENYEANEQELNEIEEKLDRLEVIRAELQRRHDQPEEDHIQEPKKTSFSADELPASSPVVSPPQQIPPICVVEPFDKSTVLPPPDYPAPQVSEDYDNFQFTPTKTQCPNCSNFITTETSTTVSSITWMVCMITAMMGCVAGCCFIPFCMDNFKSTSHKCPKCDSLITTVKKL